MQTKLASQDWCAINIPGTKVKGRSIHFFLRLFSCKYFKWKYAPAFNRLVEIVRSNNQADWDVSCILCADFYWRFLPRFSGWGLNPFLLTRWAIRLEFMCAASNIVFVDSPVGVGYSYSNTSADYNYLDDELTGIAFFCSPPSRCLVISLSTGDAWLRDWVTKLVRFWVFWRTHWTAVYSYRCYGFSCGMVYEISPVSEQWRLSPWWKLCRYW